MNVAIAITRTGATEPTILPVGVSPMVRATRPAIAAAIAPAATKISTAAMMFGRYAPIAATKLSSASMPSWETAIVSAPRKMNQKANDPTRRDGLVSGAIRSTY